MGLGFAEKTKVTYIESIKTDDIVLRRPYYYIDPEKRFQIKM